jgi:hypothetical protein
MSTTEQIISLFEGLSFADKLSLNERLASTIRKEGGGQTATPQKKRGPKAKTADGQPKPKRKAAIGTLAWMAYVKHIKETRPGDMEGLSKESEKLTLIKGIRAEEPDAYKAFVAEWKESHKEDAASSTEAESEDDSASVASSSASASASASAPAPAPAPAPATPAPKAQTAAEKIAVIKSSNAKVGGGAAATPVKTAAPATVPAAPKKAVKKVTVKEDATMPIKEIDGVSYWHHPTSNKLWEKTGDDTVSGTGPFVGFFQPGNKEEPIRYDGEFEE